MHDHLGAKGRGRRHPCGVVVGLSLAVAAGAGCAKGSSGDQVRFASPELATHTLVTALRDGDSAELRTILGPKADDIVFSGDPVDDRLRIRGFLDAYAQRHELVREGDGSVTLTVGEQKWPMPVPLVRGDDGWAFSTERGVDEIISRRIGENELDAIQVLLAVADAQSEYAHSDPDKNGVPDYAPKFLSDPGKKNGLYWPSAEGEPGSPLGPLIAEASSEGYRPSATGEPAPYHGYYYRVLTGQGPAAKGGARDYVVNGLMIGGFGVVAWPASVGNSGVMSFIVNHDGVVYQRYLGASTDAIARGMTRFDPGKGWQRVH